MGGRQMQRLAQNRLRVSTTPTRQEAPEQTPGGTTPTNLALSGGHAQALLS